MQDGTLIDEFNIINEPRHDFFCKMRKQGADQLQGNRTTGTSPVLHYTIPPSPLQ